MTSQENTNPNSNTTPSKNKSWMLWLGITSAILAGILIFFLIPDPVEVYSAEDLYAVNFEAYPNLLFPNDNNVAAELGIQNPKQKALQLYQDKTYQAAIDSITSILKNDHNHDLLFYQSIAQLATDRNTDALINLSEIVEYKQTSFLPQARWYLALAYLKIGATEEAKVYLQELANEEEGFKSNRSAAILQILKEQEAL